jgi:hypothetical protein
MAERTKAGRQAARRRGRVGGNPGLRASDPAALRKLRASRDATHLNGVLAQLGRMRPEQPWGDVVRVLNGDTARPWTVERLRRTIRRLVAEGIPEAGLLDDARRRSGHDRPVRLAANIATAAPDRTLQQIAAQLEAMRERTPRGGTHWHPSSVAHLLTRAERLDLMGQHRGRSGRISGGDRPMPTRAACPARAGSRPLRPDTRVRGYAYAGTRVSPKRVTRPAQPRDGRSRADLVRLGTRMPVSAYMAMSSDSFRKTSN